MGSLLEYAPRPEEVNELVRWAFRQPGWYAVVRTPQGDLRKPITELPAVEDADMDSGLTRVTALVPLRAGEAVRGVFHPQFLPEPDA